MHTDTQIYLASNSPRRRELLAQIGVHFQVLAIDIDETPLPGEAGPAMAARLALDKARAGRAALPARGLPALPVLGADTVVCVDDHLLGKPRDRAEALAMLARLSGRCHQVVTAVALVHTGGEAQAVSVSEVCFRSIPPAEAAAYWDSGEPVDKAGAYAIQGLGAVFIERLAGSYSGVMGLPLYETAALLQQGGVTILASQSA